MNTNKILYSAVALALCSTQAFSANWADKIQLKGFMSTVYQITDSNTSFNGEELAGISDKGNFNNTKLGINLTVPVNDKISVATQFFSALEGENNYNTHLDWATMSYKLTDEFQVRAGKIKFPAGIVNEYRDVGNSYPWISTPVLFYSVEGFGPRNTNEAYTGLSAVYELYLGDTLLSFDTFGGEFEGEALYLRQLAGVKALLNWDDIVNAQVTYYRGEIVELEGVTQNDGKIHSNLAVGLNFDYEDIIGYAEWAKTDTQVDETSSMSWYTTLGYQIGDWLPHATYQTLKRGTGTDEATIQHMTTVGLRYDLFDNADIKFEYSYINTPKGAGLFEETYNEKSDENTNMYAVAFDLVF